MFYDYVTPETMVAMLTTALGIILGYVLACMDYDSGYDKGWHQGVEDVMEIIELWEQE